MNWPLAVLLMAAVTGYPLAALLPPLLVVDSRVVTVPYRGIIFALSIWMIWQGTLRREMYTGALWVPLGVFWVLYTARMIADTLVLPVPLGVPGGEYFLYGLGTCLVPMVALFTRPADTTLRYAARLIMVLGVAALLVAVYIGVLAAMGGANRGIDSGRFEIATLNPIAVGHLGVSVATLALLEFRRTALSWSAWSLAAVIALAVGVAAAGVAVSKGPLLALTVNLGILLFLYWRDGHHLRVLVALALIPVVVIPGALFLENLGFVIISRIQLAFEDTFRLDVLTGAIDQFLAHPVFGSSLDERASLTYPHNTFLESFMAVGIVGGVAYTVFHVIGLRRAVDLILARPAAAWVGILCVQYSISALFSGSLYLVNSMWALLAAVIAAEQDVRVPRRYAAESAVRRPVPVGGAA